MRSRATSLEGVVLLEPIVLSDDRGWFMELFKDTTYTSLGLPTQFVQDNFSLSGKGVIRGLHFQVEPFEQGKLVICIQGAIFDVVIDLRPQSPTFGKWQSTELSEENKLAMYVPQGLAHGFQSLADETRVFYKCTNVYSREHEDGIIYNDSELNITWPIPSPYVSPKDLKLPTFARWRSKNI